MTQAVEDDATRPVFYESRVVALKLDRGILSKVDDEYEKLTEQANAETIDASKRDFANLDAVLGAPGGHRRAMPGHRGALRDKPRA